MFKKGGFAWEGRHPGAFTIGFYSTSRPAGDQTRGREIETNMTQILVFHRVFMTLRTKIVISLCVFDTDISKPFVFVLKMQQKIFLLASRWVAGAEIPTGIKKRMAIRAVAGRGKKAAGLKKQSVFIEFLWVRQQKGSFHCVFLTLTFRSSVFYKQKETNIVFWAAAGPAQPPTGFA